LPRKPAPAQASPNKSPQSVGGYYIKRAERPIDSPDEYLLPRELIYNCWPL
jgi:hypothetical protein